MDCNINELDSLVKVANITSTLIFRTLQYLLWKNYSPEIPIKEKPSLDF